VIVIVRPKTNFQPRLNNKGLLIYLLTYLLMVFLGRPVRRPLQ